MMTERAALADEIERRKLKFADVRAGHFEMLSEYEIELVCNALRGDGETATPPQLENGETK